jgi:hypothetical protein
VLPDDEPRISRHVDRAVPERESLSRTHRRAPGVSARDGQSRSGHEALAHLIAAIRRTLLILACPIGSAWADAPPFDRPGIAFSTGTLPAHSVAWEQGLPDFEHDSDRGVTSTLYMLDSRLRVGISDSIEVQVAASLINELETRAAGRTDRADGRSDVSFAVKAALPSPREDFTWATLAAVTDTSGANQFTNGATTYDLGVAMGFALSDSVSSELYMNAERSDGSNSVGVSPNLSVAISQSVTGFIEAGATYSGHGLDQAVAGGGFTMMVTPTVQLDVSADFGLTSKSPDVLAGFGVSVFFQ